MAPDSRRNSRGATVRGLAWAIAAWLAVLAAPAWAAIDAEQAARSVAESFGVEVLRVEPTTFDGRRVFRVTFMVPPGDRNDAFQVASVMVDAETGRLVPRFRHRESGYELPEAPSFRTGPQAPDAAERGFVWR